jgi:hypothetical protein
MRAEHGPRDDAAAAFCDPDPLGPVGAGGHLVVEGPGPGTDAGRRFVAVVVEQVHFALAEARNEVNGENSLASASGR